MTVRSVSTINGLPAHVLLVHIVVVLIPLAVLLAVLAAVWPAARRRLGVALPILTLVALIFVPITTSAGEWLEHHVDRDSYVRQHTRLADGLLPWVVVFFLLVTLHWSLDHVGRLGSRAASLRTAVAHPAARPVIAVLMVAVGVVAVVEVVRIGDSGAKAAWHDSFRP